MASMSPSSEKTAFADPSTPRSGLRTGLRCPDERRCQLARECWGEIEATVVLDQIDQDRPRRSIVTVEPYLEQRVARFPDDADQTIARAGIGAATMAARVMSFFMFALPVRCSLLMMPGALPG